MTRDIHPTRDRMIDLVHQMRRGNLGTLDGWWDIISDVEEFLAGRPARIAYSAEKWIEVMEECIRERH